ncbi:MAG: DUF4168 domain-containing protein [Deltaproteobacteria bacterium]|nr:DUF4168 domain-containing protein [Deltaproteobacteria bacterium]
MKINMVRRHLILTAAALFLGLSLSSNGVAQIMQEQPANVSDIELKAFAKAYIEIDKIRSAYEPALMGAQNPEQAVNLKKEATTKMEAALEHQGLTGERFVMIFQSVNADPELRGKTLKIIEDELQTQ